MLRGRARQRSRRQHDDCGRVELFRGNHEDVDVDEFASTIQSDLEAAKDVVTAHKSLKTFASTRRAAIEMQALKYQGGGEL